MINDNPHKKIRRTRCDVCGQNVIIDEYGNGDQCPNCGWRQTEESIEHPDLAGIMNIPSLNSAREAYRQGRSPILASFDDFLGAYDRYGEIEFTYKDTRYGVMYSDKNSCIMIWNTKTGAEQYHKTLEDFATNANINGVLLRDLWGEVKDTDFLQGD